MKKIYKFLLTAVVISSTLFYSCETTELDLLESPNSLASDKASADLLLNSVQLAYAQNEHGNGVSGFSDLSSQLTRIDNMFGRNYLSNYDGGSLNTIWTRFYSNNNVNGIVINARTIAAINAANTDLDLSFHEGMAKTLMAHNLMQLVDFLGDIPWSEAGNPVDFPSPKVDDDQAVYTAALALLDEAKVLFTNTSGIGSGTDLFYGGNASKWIKLINTLKMRADLTVGNFQAVVDATDVIDATADDFEFSFGTSELSPDTRHPDYGADYTDSGANIYQSNWLIDLMVGQFGDFSSNTDPRRRYYFYRQNWRTPGSYALFRDVNGDGLVHVSNGDGNGETLQCSLQDAPTHLQFTPDEAIWCSLKMGYWGRTHGNDEGTPPDNFTRTAVGVYPAGGSFDGTLDAFPFVGVFPNLGQQVGLGKGGGGAGIEPIMLASYVHFMQAEASLQLGNTAAAATHFEAGITTSIAKVMAFSAKDATAVLTEVPDAAAVTTFIADRVAEFNAAATTTATDATGFPVAKDKMDILGEQLFIALYGGGGNLAYNFMRRTGYPRTVSRSTEANPGSFPRTFLYPSNEISSNPNIQQRTDQSTLVFWDQGTVNPAN